MEKISALLSELAGKLELNKGADRNKALGFWEEIVGVKLAKLTVIKGFKKSVLIIKVLHPAAAMEIRLKKKTILKKLNDNMGKVLFDDIKIIFRDKLVRKDKV
ncbi:MAG: DUF721 domain-containing protein [Candidatus Brocadiales bacterium]|nr:DUF721 domain-containing protein [Candidatus Brocadiales bacterium]